MDAHCSIAFQCGHLCCSECSDRLLQCHICRRPILHRLRIFLWRRFSPRPDFYSESIFRPCNFVFVYQYFISLNLLLLCVKNCFFVCFSTHLRNLALAQQSHALKAAGFAIVVLTIAHNVKGEDSPSTGKGHFEFNVTPSLSVIRAPHLSV